MSNPYVGFDNVERCRFYVIVWDSVPTRLVHVRYVNLRRILISFLCVWITLLELLIPFKCKEALLNSKGYLQCINHDCERFFLHVFICYQR